MTLPFAINSRIALSGATILAAAAVVVGGTFAFFSDTGTPTGNVLSSGTLSLKLTDNNETAQDNVAASFGGSNLSPDVCLSPQTLELQNSGSVEGDHVDITATNTNSAFAAFLRINTLTYGGNPVVITDSNANTFMDLEDLATNGISDLSLTDLSTNHPLVVQVCLDETASAPEQGQTNTLDLSVTLTQEPAP